MSDWFHRVVPQIPQWYVFLQQRIYSCTHFRYIKQIWYTVKSSLIIWSFDLYLYIYIESKAEMSVIGRFCDRFLDLFYSNYVHVIDVCGLSVWRWFRTKTKSLVPVWPACFLLRQKLWHLWQKSYKTRQRWIMAFRKCHQAFKN